jgi:uncharacterized protein YcbX
MSIVGHVESLWRYPVKSMRGEELDTSYMGFSGVYGDRLYAFRSSVAPEGFPYLTGREQEQMLLYQPRFRHADRAAQPVNLAAAENISPGINPLYADAADFAVDVETPSGNVIAIDDPVLVEMLSAGFADRPKLSLLRSDRAITDCRPVSFISLQTARQVAKEVGITVDKRRFRANIYAELNDAGGFAENMYVGRKLRIGQKVVLSVLERDPRCKMITLDPETAQPNAELLRTVTKGHDGTAGVYSAVLVEGIVARGDKIELLREG